MLLYDFLEIIEDLKDDAREIAVEAVLMHLSKISHYAVLEAQFDWDEAMSYEDFIQYQNQIIKERIWIEICPVGKIIRRQEGLPPLTLGTNIEF